MTEERHFMVVGVFLILKDKDGKILLARRSNTGFADGDYSFPCGHVDGGENLKTALVREAEEEIGITINEGDLYFAGATHWQSNKQSVNFFFECTKWEGDPINAEPEKCDDVSWFQKEDFPKNMMKQVSVAFEAYNNNGKGFFIELQD
jgi:mutator protein MutT